MGDALAGDLGRRCMRVTWFSFQLLSSGARTLGCMLGRMSFAILY